MECEGLGLVNEEVMPEDNYESDDEDESEDEHESRDKGESDDEHESDHEYELDEKRSLNIKVNHPGLECGSYCSNKAGLARPGLTGPHQFYCVREASHLA